ncbi:hypothetical protein [Pseudomonas indica]|uniref:hypothetical protein n=1 Tax=Pseudomonas indica TaxID=137658 RepID=UPI003FD4E07F
MVKKRLQNKPCLQGSLRLIVLRTGLPNFRGNLATGQPKGVLRVKPNQHLKLLGAHPDVLVAHGLPADQTDVALSDQLFKAGLIYKKPGSCLHRFHFVLNNLHCNYCSDPEDQALFGYIALQ